MTQYSGKIIRKNPVVPSQVSASGVWTLQDAAAATKTNTWPIAGVPNPISRSVRLRSSASASFTRTMSASGTTDTWSIWCKRGKLSTIQALFDYSNASTTSFGIEFTAGDNLTLYSYSSAFVLNLITTAVYRDPSSWYHIVCVIDTTQATASNRARIYVNGVQVTSFSTATYPAQNTSLNIGSSLLFGIGVTGSANTQYFDGYLTEINFIDGQALTPSSFGTTDPLTGTWISMPYTGTYGTNGFYLNFKDNSSTGALGLDYSGNGNTWTTNNISLTAGVTYDSMTDVPTMWPDGGTGRGNYCVLNAISATFGSTITAINGNLTFNKPSSTVDWRGYGSMQLPKTGKWFWEATLTSGAPIGGTGYVYLGIADTTFGTSGFGTYFANANLYLSNGNKSQAANSTGVAYGSSYNTNGTVVGIAYDADAGTITFYNNGTSQGTAYSSISTATDWYPAFSCTGNPSTAVLDANFGQRPFSYTPPTGFVALNTFNLPASTIVNGATVMAATTFTSVSGTNVVVNTVNGVGFKPDLVWFKARSNVQDHYAVDSVRSGSALLRPNQTNAESAASYWIDSFNSNGFTTNTAQLLSIGYNYVAWQWQAGQGSSSSNTSGSITSTVSVNATAGFSVVTYTGSGSGTPTIGHGLGVAPSMIIAKTRSTANGWLVYHKSLGATQSIILNGTNAASTQTDWGNTTPTSTVFYVNGGNNNISSATYVAYCWSEVAGFSKFGSYTANGSADGPFVYCGFRPKLVMYKRTDTVGNWIIYDSSRSTYNQPAAALYPNLSNAEDTSHPSDFLSNGFKLRSIGADSNASGGTFIFMAFAENPFKNSNAR